MRTRVTVPLARPSGVPSRSASTDRVPNAKIWTGITMMRSGMTAAQPMMLRYSRARMA